MDRPYHGPDDGHGGVSHRGVSAQGVEGEGDLRRAKQYAEMIVDTVREGLLVLGFDLRVEEANASFYRMFEVGPEETRGKPIYEIGGGQWDIPKLRVLLEEILPKNKAFDGFEVRHDFPDIGRRVMLLNARRLNEHERILLAIEDVTERERVVEKLREREKRFRALVQATSYVVYRMSPDWTVMRELDGQGFIADMTRPSETWMDTYIHPDDQPAVEAAIEEAIRTQSTFELEHRVRRPDGTLGWTHSRAVPIVDEEGEIAEWFGAASDITERKEAEEALRESEERYRTLFESISEGFCILEAILDEQGRGVDYRFLTVNPAFERHTGLEDAVGKTARELVPDLEDRWPERYGRIATTGAPEHFVMESEAMGRWFEVDAFRVSDPAERKVALLFSDITERKEAEAELEEANRNLEEANQELKETNRELAETTHMLADVNETLEERVDERTRQVRRLSAALTQTEEKERRRIADLLHDHVQQLIYGANMLVGTVKRYVSQLTEPNEGLEGHQAKLEEALEELQGLLEQAGQDTRSLSAELSPPVAAGKDLPGALDWLAGHMQKHYGLTVEVDLADGFATPEEDRRAALFQMGRELLFNVVKHADVDEAQVKGWAEEGQLALSVRDEGAGFDAEALEAALEGNLKDGAGRGLSAMQRRLEAMGGALEIDAAPGEGTRITIWMPQADG
jgi:PAS domain S-box-containing protein